MKILLAADLHLHLWRKFGTDIKTGLPRRLVEQLDLIDQMRKLVDDRKIDVAMFAGDLVHKVGEIPVEVLNFAYRKFDEWGIPIYFEDGNHDIIAREDPKWYESAVEPFRRRYWEARHGQAILDNHKVKFVGVPFGSYGKLTKKIEGNDLVIVHDTPAGSYYGGYQFPVGVPWKDLAEKNKFVFFGHVHQRQHLSDNCIVIGSPMHLTFHDTGDRGVYIYDTDLGTVEFVQLNYPEFRTVESAKDVKDRYNYYRILNAENKKYDDNVVGVVTPKVYDERIKSETIEGILDEWLSISNGAPEYKGVLIPHLKEVGQSATFVNKIRLVSVDIEDFGSVGKVSYTLNYGTGFTLVSGESDMFGSNGAGKTTMTGDAIFWCLFGETTKGITGDDVIRRGEEDCMVSVELVGDDQKYTIWRSRSKGLSVMLDGKDIVKGLKQAERQKRLEEQVLGFDKTLFLASCYFSQEGLTTITGLGDADRNSLITDLLGFVQYDKLYFRCGADIKVLTYKIEGLEKDKEELKHKAEIELYRIEELKESDKNHQVSIVDDKKAMKEAMVSKDGLKKELEGVTGVTGVLPTSFDEDIKSIEDESDKLEKKVLGISEQIKGLSAKVSPLSSEKVRAMVKVDGNKRQIRGLEGNIEDLKVLKFGERCDKCGAIIDAENSQGFIDDKLLQIIELKDANMTLSSHSSDVSLSIAELEEAISDCESGKTNIDAEMRRNRDAIRSIRSDKEEAQRELQRLKLKRSDIEGRMRSLEDRISDLQDRILKTGEKASDISEKIKMRQDEIASLDKKMRDGDAEMKEAMERKEAFEFWYNAFSSKGIKSLLIDRFCNQFNRIVNEYLSDISSGAMVLDMNPTSTLKSGEERNKLSLNIAMGGDIVTYKSLSGGEKRRIDVALCMALNKWVGIKYNIPYGLLGVIILDEIFSYIDKLGEEMIGSMLYHEGVNKSILVISHTSEMSSYCGYEMYAVKKDGVSTIKENAARIGE